MRRLILIIVPAVLSAIILHSCKKADTIPPVLTLLGSDSVVQSLPNTVNAGTYTDPGALAEDNEDGNLTGNILVTNLVNPNRKGTYTVTYTVTDAAGNSTTKERVVSIVNDAEKFAGSYANSIDSCGTPNNPFVPAVTTSDTVNRLIWISNFGSYGSNIKINATITDNSLTVPLNQWLNSSMTTYISAIFSPETAVLSATAPTKFRIKYEWNNGTTTGTCTSWYQR